MDSTDQQPITLNRDVLREILVRVDYSLFLMFLNQPGYSEEVTALVSDNLFWYDRLQYIVPQRTLDELGWNEPDMKVQYNIVYIVVERARREVLLPVEYSSEFFPDRVAAERQQYLLLRRLAHGVIYLPALLLLEAIYGKMSLVVSTRQEYIKDLWTAIDDVSVLLHVVDDPTYLGIHRNVSLLKIELLLTLLPEAVKRRRTELVFTISQEMTKMDAIGSNIVSQMHYKIHEAIEYEASRGEEVDKDIVASLRALSVPNLVWWDCVAIALARNRFMWEEWSVDLTEEQASDVISNLSAKNNVSGLLFVLEQEGSSFIKQAEWSKLIIAPIQTNQVEVVRVMLPFVNLATKGNQILKYAAQYSNIEVFSLVLSDKRVNVMTNLEDVILSVLDSQSYGDSKGYTARRKKNREAAEKQVFSLTWSPVGLNGSGTHEHLLALTRHSSFSLEEPTLREIRLLCYGLGVKIDQRVTAWSLLSPDGGKQELITRMEKTDRLSETDMIVRAILLMDYDPPSLLRWMLVGEEQWMYRAARAVMLDYVPRDRDERVLSMLFIVLLRTDLSLSEVRASLLQEQLISEDEVLLAVRIACLTLGEEQSASRNR